MKARMFLMAAIMATLLVVHGRASSFTVKAGGGGNFTTIGACITAMSAAGGDTCTVFAGSYTENVTLKAGTTGNLNIVTVNAADACSPVGAGNASPTCGVTIHGSVTGASHTQFTGFEVTDPNVVCYITPATVTDVWVTGNFFTICGGAGVGSEKGMLTGTRNGGADSTSFVYILGNTFKTSCNTNAVCSVLELIGDHIMVDANDMSDSNDWVEHFGNHIVARNNTLHDGFTSHCTAASSSNCHGDMFESEPVITGNQIASVHNLWEGNQVTNMIFDGDNSGHGAEFHGFLLQGDTCSGQCSHAILRFNLYYNLASYYALNDISAGSYPSVKIYNDTLTAGGPSDLAENFNAQGTTGTTAQASMVNDLWYLYGSWTPPSNCCQPGPHDDRNNQKNGGANPFVNSTSDWHLAAASAPIGAGTSLTTASNAGVSSTSLTVADPFFFQDGWGFPLGTSVGQMSPDWLRIGGPSGPTVQITSGGINYGTGAISLAAAVSWSSGDGIYLYKRSDGSAVLNPANAQPDQGAFPFGLGGGSGGSSSGAISLRAIRKRLHRDEF